jgi:prevent-host-death family protein
MLAITPRICPPLKVSGVCVINAHNSASLSFHVAIAFSRFLMTQLSLMVYTSHSQKVSKEKSYDSIAKIVRLAYNMDEPNLDEKEESYMSITATELKQNLSKYLLMAEREDVFITRNGKVVAKLTNPYQDRVDMAKSLFGIIPGDMTIEQAHRERLETV